MQNSIQQLFRNHQFAFVKLLAFRIQMVLAYQMMAVVVGWHIYELTHDPLALGLIGLAEVIPYFSCALFAGHAVDHYYSRRAFGVLAAVLLCLNALTLMAVSHGMGCREPTMVDLRLYRLHRHCPCVYCPQLQHFVCDYCAQSVPSAAVLALVVLFFKSA